MILNKKSKLKGKLLYASKHQEGGIIRVSSYDDPAFKAESDSTASANISIKMLADIKKHVKTGLKLMTTCLLKLCLFMIKR